MELTEAEKNYYEATRDAFMPECRHLSKIQLFAVKMYLKYWFDFTEANMQARYRAIIRYDFELKQRKRRKTAFSKLMTNHFIETTIQEAMNNHRSRCS